MAYLDTNGLNTFWTKLKGRFQDKLVSGTNIKTINNESILGSGNISVGGGGGGATVFEIMYQDGNVFELDEYEEISDTIGVSHYLPGWQPIAVSGYVIQGTGIEGNQVRLTGWNLFGEAGGYALTYSLYNDASRAEPVTGYYRFYVLYASTPDTYDGEVE